MHSDQSNRVYTDGEVIKTYDLPYYYEPEVELLTGGRNVLLVASADPDILGTLLEWCRLNNFYLYQAVRHSDDIIAIPCAAILFGQDWYKTTTKTPELFADIAYVVIQSYSMKTESYQEQASIITKDFVRTLTRQISPPIRYLVFVAGNEDLTVSQVEYILTRAYPDEDSIFTTGTILDNALADNIGLILGFAYSRKEEK